MQNTNQYNHAFKGLNWVQRASEMSIALIGVGGIGSWLAYLLSNIVSKIEIFDDDKIEERNLSGQLFSYQQIGEYKVNAVKDLILTLKGKDCSYIYNNNFKVENLNDIEKNCIFLGVDSLDTRRKLLKSLDLTKKIPIIDGRLDAEKFQVYTIAEGVEDEKGNILTYNEAYSKYLNYHCPSDESNQFTESCTTKQTAYWANGVAWAMIKQFTKYVSILNGLPMYLPFKIEQDLWS